MVIIAGYYLVDEHDRDRIVAVHQDLVMRARRADGCIDCAISADSVDPRRINNLEVWRDAAALDAWRAVADAPDIGVEIVVGDTMKRYDAEDGGPLF
jgi:quinol monooxygenase YgiN